MGKIFRLIIIGVLSCGAAFLFSSCFLTFRTYVKEHEGIIAQQEDAHIFIDAAVHSYNTRIISPLDMVDTLNKSYKLKRRYPGLSFNKSRNSRDAHVYINIHNLKFDVEEIDKTDEMRAREEDRYERKARQAKISGDEPPEEPNYTITYVEVEITITHSTTVEIWDKNYSRKILSIPVSKKITRRFTKHNHKSGTPLITLLMIMVESAASDGLIRSIKSRLAALVMKKISDVTIDNLNKVARLYSKNWLYLVKISSKEDKYIREHMKTMEQRKVLIEYLIENAKGKPDELKSKYYFNTALLYYYEKDKENFKEYYRKALEYDTDGELERQYRTICDRTGFTIY